MDRDTCIIYIGSRYTVEWYYDRAGKSPGHEYFLETTEKQQKKFTDLVKEIADTDDGKIIDKKKFRYEGDQIYAFKSNANRYLSFFVHGGKIIVTNGFVKKTDKLPITEKERAERLKQDYINRNKEGSYYGNAV